MDKEFLSMAEKCRWQRARWDSLIRRKCALEAERSRLNREIEEIEDQLEQLGGPGED